MADAPHHVVVVEDNITTNNLLRDWLKLAYHVTCFLDAESLRKLLPADDQPVVFVVDYNLPGEDGLSLQAHLQDGFPAGKTILISGLFDQELTQRAEDAGVDATLSKPFTLPTLDEKIRELLGLPPSKPNLVEMTKEDQQVDRG
ncbi:MAG: response regulator [Verrucomicrobiota bacterium]